MKEMGVTLITVGSVLLIMAGGGIFGNTALAVAMVMILAGLIFIGAARVALTVVSIGLLIAIGLSLSGCAAPRQAMQLPSAPPTSAAVEMLSNGPGKVPVVIINSSQLVRHLWLFEGNEPVNVVPDYRTGKWVLSRPPLIDFYIAPAKNSNWAEEKMFYYPRNMAFLIYDQPERFWGEPVGQAFVASGYAGPNPAATTYWRPTPSGGQAVAGAVIQLPWVDAAGPTNGLRLEMDINPGAPIKEGIGRALR